MNTKLNSFNVQTLREVSTESKNFVSTWQIILCLAFVDVLVFILLFDLNVGMLILSVIVITAYLYVVSLNLFAVAIGFTCGRKILANPEIQQRNTRDWPIYTILVPLFREANVIARFVEHILTLDYPPSKLDVLFLFEQDDLETQLKFETINKPDFCRSIIVPNSVPQTKPKACNTGLRHAVGEFIVVYDAEDRPEIDQLKKSVLAFETSSPKVACVQCKLNFYNPRDNLLTKLFVIDYTIWYDLFLPGLYSLGGPIPLGGTSNHFRLEQLRSFGSWDPYNVTEDCDLGIRISRLGFQTLLLDSVTWEEANSSLGNWIRQRSRWIKGYMQTHLTHMKNPSLLLQQLGLIKTLLFFGSVGLRAFVQVLNPILWAIVITYLWLLILDIGRGYALYDIIAGHQDPSKLAWKLLYIGAEQNNFWSMVSLVSLVFATILLFYNFVLMIIGFVATRRHGYEDLWYVAFLSPFYWGLVSIAAWRALYQLFTKPYYWEKTIHGLDLNSKAK